MTAKDKGAPAHSVTHTDAAKGRGGGATTQDPGLPEANPTEHEKNRAWRDPSGEGLPETDAEDAARRKETTGRDLGFTKG